MVSTCTYEDRNCSRKLVHRLSSTVCAVRSAPLSTTRLLTVERPTMGHRFGGAENASSVRGASPRSSESKTFQSWSSNETEAGSTSIAPKFWRDCDQLQRTLPLMGQFSKRWPARLKSSFASKEARSQRVTLVRPCCSGSERSTAWPTCDSQACIKILPTPPNSLVSLIFWRRKRRVRRSVGSRNPPDRNRYRMGQLRVLSIRELPG
jgi:hypothetical protein